MCTAISFKTKDHYFGRTLDYGVSFNETITITPRNYEFHFRNGDKLSAHYALIGTAFVMDNTPLYYEAVNEAGVGMAGLNFPKNAHYFEPTQGKDNIASFEFIPYILGKCKNMTEVRRLLKNINITNQNFSDNLPTSPLHWIICDKNEAVTVESMADGLKIYENPVGVLTNNPPFDYHMTNLVNYRHLSNKQTKNNLDIPTAPFCEGLGAIGLPGDLTSPSRFIRTYFTKKNSVCGDSENESVSQLFHILDTVSWVKGSVLASDGHYETTIYTSCCNTDKGIYYYTTYENRSVTSVDMHKEDLDSSELISYPMKHDLEVYRQN